MFQWHACKLAISKRMTTINIYIFFYKDVDIDNVVLEFGRLKGRRLALCL